MSAAGAGPPFFRFRRLGARTVVTSLEGEYLVLGDADFERLRTGTVEAGSALAKTLAEKNLLPGGHDLARAARRLRARKAFLDHGPNLHIVVITLRCNETCVYCHASRAPLDAVGKDMPPEIADRVIDLILQSTSPRLTIEFQGGEPLAHFEGVRRFIDTALERNRAVGKQLEFTLVSNLALMDEEKLAYLLDKRVQICTSLDGPAGLHDSLRKLPGGSAHERTVFWLGRINQAYRERGLDPSLYHVEALLTTTRETLPRWREIVDAYVALGCRALFLRPVDPFGFAGRGGRAALLEVDEYLEFYRRAVDYMIELGGQGVEILERYAALFLTKILGATDPNYLDIRSPCGAGIGQLAYNYDGRVFTCDEGRMLHEMGDSFFALGDVREATYPQVIGHDTVRALVLASNLDGQVDCVQCAYQPFCGACPVHCYRTQGNIFGRMREAWLCRLHKGIQDYLFTKLGEADPVVLANLRRWTTVRERSHFIHGVA